MTKRFYPSPVRKAGTSGRGSLHERSGRPGNDQADPNWLDELVAPNLKLEEEAERESTGSGYDPYDTVPNVREAHSMQRHAELRQLSDWIRQKRQASKGSGTETEPPGALPGLRWFWSGRRR